MSSTKTRIALAAALAALSAPALAGEASSCSVCDDPTWPAIESPAPALAVNAVGGEPAALARVDPTWPATDSAAPAVALALHPEDGPAVEPPAEWAPKAHYAVDLTSSPRARRVAEK